MAEIETNKVLGQCQIAGAIRDVADDLQEKYDDGAQSATIDLFDLLRVLGDLADRIEAK